MKLCYNLILHIFLPRFYHILFYNGSCLYHWLILYNDFWKPLLLKRTRKKGRGQNRHLVAGGKRSRPSLTMKTKEAFLVNSVEVVLRWWFWMAILLSTAKLLKNVNGVLHYFSTIVFNAFRSLPCMFALVEFLGGFRPQNGLLCKVFALRNISNFKRIKNKELSSLVRVLYLHYNLECLSYLKTVSFLPHLKMVSALPHLSVLSHLKLRSQNSTVCWPSHDALHTASLISA